MVVSMLLWVRISDARKTNYSCHLITKFHITTVHERIQGKETRRNFLNRLLKMRGAIQGQTR